MDESRYEELLEAEEEGTLARVQAAMEEVRAGNVQRYDSVADLMETIRRAADADIGSHDKVYRG
jgi:hypothetical protein